MHSSCTSIRPKAWWSPPWHWRGQRRELWQCCQCWCWHPCCCCCCWFSCCCLTELGHYSTGDDRDLSQSIFAIRCSGMMSTCGWLLGYSSCCWVTISNNMKIEAGINGWIWALDNGSHWTPDRQCVEDTRLGPGTYPHPSSPHHTLTVTHNTPHIAWLHHHHQTFMMWLYYLDILKLTLPKVCRIIMELEIFCIYRYKLWVN